MAGKGIIESAAILTIAGLINRVLGFVYRIYMSNVLGAEGMGLYQLIMPIYSLAWSISCSGFTTTVSKLTASEKAKGEYGNMGRFLKQALAITSLIGILLSILLLTFADSIAINLFKDERLTMALKILSLSFPFMSTGSCIRGYFTGLQEPAIPAISQVFEQCVRMVVVFALSSSFIKVSLEYACAIAVCGVFAGELLSFILVLGAYKGFKRKHSFTKKPTLTSRKSWIMLLSMAMPLTLNRITGSLLSTFENLLLPQKLVEFGMTNSQAVSEFGKISGMAMPLIQFPSAILVSVAISLVPAISEYMAIGLTKQINFTISKVVLFTTITGIGAAGIFITFSDVLGNIIYNENISQMLMYLGIMCPFIYLQTTLSGILNGLGEQLFIFKNSLLSSAISIAFILFAVPHAGITGYILGWFISLILICFLNLMRIKKTAKIELKIVDWFIKPTLCIVLTCLCMNLAKPLIFARLGNILGLIASICCLGIIYMVFIVTTGCFTKKDLKMILKRS